MKARVIENLKKQNPEIAETNKNFKVEKVYKLYHKSNNKNFIRIARPKLTGNIYNSKGTLEKYNPNLDSWEEYKEPVLSIKEINEQINDIQYQTMLIAYDVQSFGKILDSLPDSNNANLLDSDGLMCIGRTLKSKAKQLLEEVDRLQDLDDDIKAIIENKSL